LVLLLTMIQYIVTMGQHIFGQRKKAVEKNKKIEKACAVSMVLLLIGGELPLWEKKKDHHEHDHRSAIEAVLRPITTKTASSTSTTTTTTTTSTTTTTTTA
jgi:hypothetical protein